MASNTRRTTIFQDGASRLVDSTATFILGYIESENNNKMAEASLLIDDSILNEIQKNTNIEALQNKSAEADNIANRVLQKIATSDESWKSWATIGPGQQRVQKYTKSKALEALYKLSNSINENPEQNISSVLERSTSMLFKNVQNGLMSVTSALETINSNITAFEQLLTPEQTENLKKYYGTRIVTLAVHSNPDSASKAMILEAHKELVGENNYEKLTNYINKGMTDIEKAKLTFGTDKLIAGAPLDEKENTYLSLKYNQTILANIKGFSVETLTDVARKQATNIVAALKKHYINIDDDQEKIRKRTETLQEQIDSGNISSFALKQSLNTKLSKEARNEISSQIADYTLITRRLGYLRNSARIDSASTAVNQGFTEFVDISYDNPTSFINGIKKLNENFLRTKEVLQEDSTYMDKANIAKFIKEASAMDEIKLSMYVDTMKELAYPHGLSSLIEQTASENQALAAAMNMQVMFGVNTYELLKNVYEKALKQEPSSSRAESRTIDFIQAAYKNNDNIGKAMSKAYSYSPQDSLVRSVIDYNMTRTDGIYIAPQEIKLNDGTSTMLIDEIRYRLTKESLSNSAIGNEELYLMNSKLRNADLKKALLSNISGNCYNIYIKGYAYNQAVVDRTGKPVVFDIDKIQQQILISIESGEKRGKKNLIGISNPFRKR